MNSKEKYENMTPLEALETLGNVDVAVTTIKSGVTHFKTLKEQYAKEFEVLEKELLFVRDIKPFDVYEEQYKKLKKALDILKEYICITKRRNEVNGNYDISCIYSLGSYKDITKDEYELLNSVMEEN